eukprot:scaffold273_cov526-Pavlova_lutheri.AAC.1
MDSRGLKYSLRTACFGMGDCVGRIPGTRGFEPFGTCALSRMQWIVPVACGSFKPSVDELLPADE